MVALKKEMEVFIVWGADEGVVESPVARMLLTTLSGMRAWPRIGNCP